LSASTFQCLLVNELADDSFRREVARQPIEALPSGELLIRVHFSSLNYKDALSATGNKGVTRRYPHIPGVDAAGIVEESRHRSFKVGDKVVVTGNDLGSNTWGGFSEFIRVPAEWTVPLPHSLSMRESMIYGTAGFTAALSLHKLMLAGVKPSDGEILVTGATGGVGCLAVALLAVEGFSTVAATGKLNEQKFLKTLGASEVIDRKSINDTTHRPLLSGRWAGVIDTVGGKYLDSAIRSTKLEGTVTTCGNVTGGDLQTSIYPFILRGVNLLGIGSAFCPMDTRLKIWNRLAGSWKLPDLNSLHEEITLHELDNRIRLMLKGGVKGRVLVNLNSEAPQ